MHARRRGTIRQMTETESDADSHTVNTGPRSHSTTERFSRRCALTLVVILAASGLWRVAMAEAMPCISRDGALFCWYARDLGREGVGLLQTDRYDQQETAHENREARRPPYGQPLARSEPTEKKKPG